MLHETTLLDRCLEHTQDAILRLHGTEKITQFRSHNGIITSVDRAWIKPLISVPDKCLTLFLFSIEWPVRIYEIEQKASIVAS
jgi:hypothetical protein